MRMRCSGPTTTTSIGRARQHSVGDLLRRTAPPLPGQARGRRRRPPDHLRRVRRRGEPEAAALAARGLAKGDRLALLSHNSWQYAVLVFATARLGVVLVPVNFMLGADEIAFILRPLRGERDGRRGRAGARPRRRRWPRPGVDGGVRGWIALSGAAPPAGWEDVDGWWTDGPDTARRTSPVADDDPLRLMYTSGTESRPKGVMLSSRSLIAPVRQLRDRRRHGAPTTSSCTRCRCTTAPSWTASSPSTSTSARRASSCPAPTRRRSSRPSPASGSPSCSARRRCGSRCCGTPTSTPPTCRSLRKGYYGASAMPVEVLRELQRRLPDVQLWNFYGQTEMAPLATILRPHEQLPAGRLGRAGRRSTSRRCWSTTTATRSRPGRSARSCTAARTPRWATTRTRRRPPRRSPAAGSTPATSAS